MPSSRTPTTPSARNLRAVRRAAGYGGPAGVQRAARNRESTSPSFIESSVNGGPEQSQALIDAIDQNLAAKDSRLNKNTALHSDDSADAHSVPISTKNPKLATRYRFYFEGHLCADFNGITGKNAMALKRLNTQLPILTSRPNADAPGTTTPPDAMDKTGPPTVPTAEAASMGMIRPTPNTGLTLPGIDMILNFEPAEIETIYSTSGMVRTIPMILMAPTGQAAEMGSSNLGNFTGPDYPTAGMGTTGSRVSVADIPNFTLPNLDDTTMHRLNTFNERSTVPLFRRGHDGILISPATG